ncbi:glycoside hydrolase family 38 N-terminal domain-containing protein [Massiliimalia timonensis]|uniref:glycoside hydrolase family 38 N-terminal domain-containing protein n=1 Tax=Massiliimalia timonensis TaxID=1987501 RepID=UPI000B8B856C|nr:glycoside hydrolase family 38 C-terminal domain-containing protein [Massiliimalia timonensis]
MSMPKKHVIGLTHIDVAWKKGKQEMAEHLDTFLLRLVNLLENHPNTYYILEQAIHYRELKKRDPKLFAAILKYVQEGRLEFATGLASTIENNLTNGESFVRNLQIGTRWLKENMGVSPVSCMMIDTFGFPPQIPQILVQTGCPIMIANRLGGTHYDTNFQISGLDGSKLWVIGRDVQTPVSKNDHIAFQFYQNREQLTPLFREAKVNDSSPLMVMPYTENEVCPSEMIFEQWSRPNRAGLKFTKLSEFLENLSSEQRSEKIYSADLNPEFTGTFALRHRLKLLNRRAETLLLEAEKLSALYGAHDKKEELEECWWDMAYTQFHDVLTGSHQTDVYSDCVQTYNKIMANSQATITSLLVSPADRADRYGEYTIWNGLPFDRTELITVPVTENLHGKTPCLDGKPVPFFTDGNSCCCSVPISAMSAKTLLWQDEVPSSNSSRETSGVCVLENQYIRLELGNGAMIKSLYDLKHKTELLSECDNLLVLQKEDGNFQYEEPDGNEISCGWGSYQIKSQSNHIRQKATVTGSFPGEFSTIASYELTFSLEENSPFLDIDLHITWKGEGYRLRLGLDSTLQETANYYEIPFGVVQRFAYFPRFNAKGEWPAQRFVCMESRLQNRGLALINNGMVGVEILDGQLRSTLLRAPTKEYAGMVPDDTSSDHGEHDFKFRILPYQGSWKNSGVLELAQRFNTPLEILKGGQNALSAGVRVSNPHIVLSCIKPAEDQLCAVRMYESTGESVTAEITLQNAVKVFLSDVKELPLEGIELSNGKVQLDFKPFEIKTILVKWNSKEEKR